MEETVPGEIEQSEINRQNMHLTITNRRSWSLKKPQEEVKREIAARLYRIFKKYWSKQDV